MSSLRIKILPSSSSSSQKRVHAHAAINVPKLQRVRISLPKNPTSFIKLVQEFNGSVQAIVPSQEDVITTSSQTTFQHYSYDPNKSEATIMQLYETLKAVADSVEMHKIVSKQRNNWNYHLLKSINMMLQLNATIHSTALKLTSILLLSDTKAMLLIKKMIHTSKRKATRLFMKLHTDIQTMLTRANPTKEDVAKLQKKANNGWSPELEKEMREILEVMRRKDMEDYERRGNLALKINKILAIIGPLLAAIAAIGSALERHGSSWAGIVAVVAGSLADSMKALEGVVLEMYRSCGGFFKLLQEAIEATLEEKDVGKRENGELFEKKVARKLGRSVSQLRTLASKFAAYDSEGTADEDELPASSSNFCT